MGLSRIKNWISGEKLYATDLNAEFNNIITNAASLISPVTATFDLDGNTLIMDAAGATTVVSTTASSWNFSSGSKTGTPGTTGTVSNWSSQIFTDSNTGISGTAAIYIGHAFKRPTLVATNSGVTTTDAATVYIENAPLGSTNETITSPWALWTDDGAVRHDLTKTVASAAGAVLRGMYLPAVTETITGSTNITTATGFNLVEIGQPTLSAGTAMTVTNSATVYIADAPVGGGAGPATITNAYALWVDSGATRLDGALICGGTTTAIDGSFSINGSSDATKQIGWEVDGNTTGTRRVITAVDYDSRMMTQTHGADIASATTTVLDTATGDLVDVTGTTTITAITLAEGRMATVRFTGILTLTNGASLLLPGAANITTAAGDIAVFRGYAAGVVRCVSYTRLSLLPHLPTAAEGSSMVLLNAQSVSGVATIDFVSLLTSTYDEYELHVMQLLAATDAQDLWLRIGTGSTFQAGASDYIWGSNRATSGSVNSVIGSNADTKITTNINMTNNGQAPQHLVIRVTRPADTGVKKSISFSGGYQQSGAGSNYIGGSGYYTTNTNAFTSLRLLMSSGNISTAFCYLYGIKNS